MLAWYLDDLALAYKSAITLPDLVHPWQRRQENEAIHEVHMGTTVTMTGQH
jgi:hypothetical protein